jgi:hypothetical protein
MSDENMSDEKKIIVDEDWKNQIEAEKESLEREAESEPPSEPSAGQMPPASFEMLVTMFATEAMVAMGQIPHPATQQMSLSPEHARYTIDMLEMIQKKTKGNLESGEETMLIDLLHQLRMLFVAVQSPVGGAAEAEEKSESPIITPDQE